MSFYSFVMRYLKQNDSFGDLARYIEGQEHFPKGGNYQDIVNHLHINGASESLLEAFDMIYDGPYTRYMRDVRRVQDALVIRNNVYYRDNCIHDDGRIRDAYKQRPEITLLAVIAKGLFDIADAIREKK